jgi:hypothetical protein
LSAKEIKQVNDDRAKLTEHFIPTLPLLLSKYSADPDKVTNLMGIPQHFELDVYVSSRQEKSLDALLRTIQDLVERHTDTEVLEACAKTLETLCADNLAIYTRCDVARSTLIDMLVNKFKEALDEYNSLIEGVNNFCAESLIFSTPLNRLLAHYFLLKNSSRTSFKTELEIFQLSYPGIGPFCCTYLFPKLK